MNPTDLFIVNFKRYLIPETPIENEIITWEHYLINTNIRVLNEFL
jgi:hypothetical protein